MQVLALEQHRFFGRLLRSLEADDNSRIFLVFLINWVPLYFKYGVTEVGSDPSLIRLKILSARATITF